MVPEPRTSGANTKPAQDSTNKTSAARTDFTDIGDCERRGGNGAQTDAARPCTAPTTRRTASKSAALPDSDPCSIFGFGLRDEHHRKR